MIIGKLSHHLKRTREKKYFIKIGVSLLLMIASNTIIGQSTTQENTWDKALRSSTDKTDIIEIDANNKTFIGLLTENNLDQTEGAVLLLHSMGKHPNWRHIISPVRKGLPNYGWTTLSIQLPVFSADTDPKKYLNTFEASNARINASIQILKNKGIKNIVLLGHEWGAITALKFLSTAPQKDLSAIVGISIPVYKGEESKPQVLKMMESTTIPFLDLFASQDKESVVSSAIQRAHAAKKAGKLAIEKNKLETLKQSATALSNVNRKTGFIAYRQIIIRGSNSSFSGHEDIIVKRIAGWLKQHAKGITIQSIQSD